MYWIQGLSFAKFFSPWSCYYVFLGLQSRVVVLRPVFFAWLCRACARTKGLLCIKFSLSGLVYSVFCGSSVEAGFRSIFIFLAWFYRTFVGIRGLISLNLSRAGFVFNLFSGSRAQADSLQFFVPWLCLAFIGFRALIFAKFVTPWLCFWCSAAPGQKLFPEYVERYLFFRSRFCYYIQDLFFAAVVLRPCLALAV